MPSLSLNQASKGGYDLHPENLPNRGKTERWKKNAPDGDWDSAHMEGPTASL